MRLCKTLTAFWLCRSATADSQYRSRPDLSPPRLNITLPATKDVGTGYLFVAPFARLPDTPHVQHALAKLVLTSCETTATSSGPATDTTASGPRTSRSCQWQGQDVLACFEGDYNPNYGHGHGHVTLLDRHYKTVRELRAGRHKISDKHEFQVVDGETALIQIYQQEARDLNAYGAKPEEVWIVNAIFQELNIETREVLFEWSSLDHVSPDESMLPVIKGQAGSGYNSSYAWDYFHINSVDKDISGNYLISARDACGVHKVNGRTAASSGGSVGSTQVLPNGNVLVNWGSEGAMTEYLPNGTVIFHAYMASGELGVGVQNYRAYRYHWTGVPHEEPAVAAYEDESGTSVNVSWNGDTETKLWRLLGHADGEFEPYVLGEVSRTSFKTILSLPGRKVSSVSVVAVDEAGEVIGSTQVEKSRPDVLSDRIIASQADGEAQRPFRTRETGEHLV
ncbi:hypothetical protein LTR17_005856 [Elasticomyces elasticus]|nr:hypothetical protein LTR17_005856 [Elasticomyces elasticus]